MMPQSMMPRRTFWLLSRGNSSLTLKCSLLSLKVHESEVEKCVLCFHYHTPSLSSSLRPLPPSPPSSSPLSLSLTCISLHVHSKGKIDLQKGLHLWNLSWSTVEGELIASAKACLEVSLGAQTSQLAKVHDAYARAQVVCLLHRVGGEDLREGRT